MLEKRLQNDNNVEEHYITHNQVRIKVEEGVKHKTVVCLKYISWTY